MVCAHLQRERFIPLGIEGSLDGFCLFLHIVRVGNESGLDVGIR